MHGRLIIRSGGLTYEARPGALETHPDPAWAYRDPAGHEHRWVWPERGEPFATHASVPSCRMMQHVSFRDGEQVRTARYECSLCGAPVQPGRVTEQVYRYVIVSPSRARSVRCNPGTWSLELT
jgi:hypothetical protein